MGYIKPKAIIMTMWRRGFLKRLEKGSGDRFLILVYLVNIQYSGKESNSSREQVVNPVSLLWMIHMPFSMVIYSVSPLVVKRRS